MAGRYAPRFADTLAIANARLGAERYFITVGDFHLFVGFGRRTMPARTPTSDTGYSATRGRCVLLPLTDAGERAPLRGRRVANY
jgi:hypothetical protein